RWFIKNINSDGKKAISTSTYSNDFIKSQPSISTKQHRFMKNVSRNGTKAISISTYIIKPQPSISTNQHRLMKNVNRNGTKATPTSTYSHNFIKSLPSFPTNQRWFIKNINSDGKKAISTSTYSNDFIKSQPSISTKQHRFMKNVENIYDGTKATSTLASINDDIAVNNSNNVNKLLLSTHRKKLVPLVAYGIYRPVSYYDLSEWTFRILNGYDDGYLIQIFEDCDYVIFTKIV
ncbi:Uncharacterized protein BM_BM815, partial [Brugia malayi]